MKKLLLFPLLALLISLASVPSRASLKTREQWWESRLDKLQKEHHALSAKHIAAPVGKALSRDIQASRELLQTIAGMKQAGGTTVPLSAQSIDDTTKKWAGAAFSIHFLNHLLARIGTRDWLDEAHSKVRKAVNKEISRRFVKEYATIGAKLVYSSLPEYQWKYLSMEMLLGQAITTFPDLKQKAVTTIHANVTRTFLELPRQQQHYDRLLRITEKCSEAYLNGLDYRELVPASASPEKSWVWNQSSSLITRELSLFTQVRELLEFSLDRNNLQKLVYYNEHHKELENTAFALLAKNLCDNRKFTRAPESEQQQSATTLAIPREPEMRALFNEIDRARRKKMRSITGHETAGEFKAMRHSFATLISRYLGKAGSGFKHETDRLRNELPQEEQSDHTESGFSTKTEHDFAYFFEAKKIYRSKFSQASRYAKKSLLFLEWFSAQKRIKGELFLKAYRYRVARNREYLAFICSLYKESDVLGSWEAPASDARLHAARRRVRDLFQTIGFSNSISRRTRSYLSKDQVARCQSLKAETTVGANEMLQTITDNYAAYASRRQELLRNRQAQSKKTEHTLAQREVDLLDEAIHGYYNTYKEFRYGSDALERYCQLFDELYKETSSGTFSDRLNKVLKEGTLLTVVDNFDRNLLQEEHASRQFLVQKIMETMSQLVTLRTHYTREKIATSSIFSGEEINRLKQEIYLKPEVSIAGWEMNEENYRTIDLKAVQLLAKVRKNKTWEKQMGQASKTSEHTTHYIPQLDISLEIPAGWQSTHPAKEELSKGIICSFTNQYDCSSFYVARLPLKQHSVQEMAQTWIESMDKKTVRVKWGKSREQQTPFYWTLSRDEKKNIMEAYLIERGTSVIIISCETTKNRYPYIKKNIRDIFGSIKNI